MGKYLRDVRFECPELTKKGLTDAKIETYRNLYSETLKSVGLIQFLFNQHIEQRKYKTQNNIWRYIIELTPNKEKHHHLDGTCLEVIELAQYFDNDELKQMSSEARKKKLLLIFTEGLIEVSKRTGFDGEIFNEIQTKIIKDNIIFDKACFERKFSPNRKQFAIIWGLVTEEEHKTFVVINDISSNKETKILIGEYWFEMFDKIKWIDNDTIYLFQVSPNAYKEKNAIQDYFQISISSEKVIYLPQTVQNTFEYGIKLLTDTNNYNEAMELIEKAAKMGHGKAINVLNNLKINPNNRNKAQLGQMPKEKQIIK